MISWELDSKCLIPKWKLIVKPQGAINKDFAAILADNGFALSNE